MRAEPIRDPDVLARMKATFELAEMAEAIMRQNLRRRHPDAGEPEIERLLAAWYLDRPGAEQGDALGRPVDRLGIGR